MLDFVALNPDYGIANELSERKLKRRKSHNGDSQCRRCLYPNYRIFGKELRL